MNVFDGIPCRRCGRCTLRLEWRLECRVVFRRGTRALATEWPYCVCTSCGAESRGHQE